VVPLIASGMTSFSGASSPLSHPQPTHHAQPLSGQVLRHRADQAVGVLGLDVLEDACTGPRQRRQRERGERKSGDNEHPLCTSSLCHERTGRPAPQ
jgi:hypothetical protein